MLSKHRKSFTVPVSDDVVFTMCRVIRRAEAWAHWHGYELINAGAIIESISITTHGTATAEAVVVTEES